MPMAPPKHLAGPRARLDSHRGNETLVGLAPPAERRPEPVNPPPPESMRPAEPAPTGQVVLGKGKWAMSMPSAVAMALIACLGGALTAWINKPQQAGQAEILKAIDDAAAKTAVDRKPLDDAIVKRLGDDETALQLLRLSVEALNNRVTDRLNAISPQPVDPLRDRMNDRLRK